MQSSDLQRIKTHEIDGGAANAIGDRAQAVRGEIKHDVARRLVTIGKNKSASLQSNGMHAHAELAGTIHGFDLPIANGRELFAQTVLVQLQARIQLERRSEDTRGQGPLPLGETIYNVVVEPRPICDQG
jgi:hypothetical protein